ncbi:MAG TPA: endolytic transglycosylase MltG [Solirubrobacteraceae bacterium]|nr:endolytic transglycosylase MltG [Solirubrobacteraceae bacterium]
MAERSERSPEEREAARLERERRRGRSVEASTPPPEPEPPAALPESREMPPEPGAGLPEPTDEWLVPATDGDEPAESEHDQEVASGTRRVGWRERTGAIAAAPRVPRRRGPPAQTNGPAPSARRRSTVRVLALVALLLAAAVIWFCVELFQPFHGSGHGSVTVTIPPHTGTSGVGSLLERDGVVASGFFFELRAALGGDSGKIMAGSYHLQQDMSYGQALKVLTTPPPAAKVTNVTLVPGRTRVEISGLLRTEGVKGSYFAATRRSPLLNPSAYGAPRGTHSLEGFLFPDTYQVREPISIGALVADQLKQFRTEFATVGLGYARSKHLTPYDVLIIASIVEEEAATAHDRPLVASVIYNRLKDGIALGMDSTSRYEFNDYTKPLTSSQLSAQSPYNTRIHKGLTPTPIGNPGLSAIEAAAHPARTHYLYFVVKPCGNGASVFSSNYHQFLADSARYQSARAQNGGRSPTKC